MSINSLNFMLVEMLIFLAAAAVLGLLVGWLMRGSIAKRKAAEAANLAEQKFQALEESSQQDTKNLEDQMQALADELKTTKAHNQDFSKSLQANKQTIQKARDEAIELNQAQLETNERLQTIIREKDVQISRLMSSSTANNANLAAAAATMGASPTLINKVVNQALLNELDNNDTLDATTVLSGPLSMAKNHSEASEGADTTLAALDATTNQLRSERQALLDALSDGEQTIAIDQRDLPLGLATDELSDIDATVAIEEFDETVTIQPSEDDTDLNDTLKHT
jgi:Tfp pilus assembly protein PilE